MVKIFLCILMTFFLASCSSGLSHKPKSVQNVLLCRLTGVADTYPKNFKGLQEWQFSGERALSIGGMLINISDSAVFLPFEYSGCLPLHPNTYVLYSYGKKACKAKMSIYQKKNIKNNKGCWLQPNDTVIIGIWFDDDQLKRLGVLNHTTSELMKNVRMTYIGTEKSTKDKRKAIRIIFIRTSGMKYKWPFKAKTEYEFVHVKVDGAFAYSV